MKLPIIAALTAAITLFALEVPTASARGQYTTGVSITEVEVLPANPNYVQVLFSATMTTAPGTTLTPCVTTGYRDRLIFDATTAQGKTYLSMVLAAFLAGRKVRADGTNACPGTYGVEGMRWFDVFP